jgi:Cu-Zn family superoxide dismutase
MPEAGTAGAADERRRRRTAMKPNYSAVLLVALFALGCDRDASARHGVAYFTGVKGFESIGGGARLEEAPPGVRMVVWLNQAPPGPKGVHVHEKGDCTDALAATMGKHFAPHDEPHGLPGAAKHHPGDLGNLMVRDDGNGSLELSTSAGNLIPGDPMSFLNRAIVIHQGEDKGTQPSGDSGQPLACAVIKVN